MTQLGTRNYLLRPFRQADIENVFKALSHPEVIKYYGVSYETLEHTQVQIDWFARIESENTGRWRAISSFDDQTFFGGIGLNDWSHEHRKAAFGLWLLPEHWGKGVMNEAIPALLEFGFTTMNLHRIEAEVETLNIRCQKLLSKLGFQHEGTKVDCESKSGAFVSLDLFARINSSKRCEGGAQ